MESNTDIDWRIDQLYSSRTFPYSNQGNNYCLFKKNVVQSNLPNKISYKLRNPSLKIHLDYICLSGTLTYQNQHQKRPAFKDIRNDSKLLSSIACHTGGAWCPVKNFLRETQKNVIKECTMRFQLIQRLSCSMHTF